MRRLIVLLSLLLIFMGGFYLYYKEGTLPADRNSRESKIFVIKPGENLSSIANNLSDQKLIRNKIIFYLVVKRFGIERKIQAGDFRLSPAMDTHEITKALTHGTLDVWVTLIEGMRKEEVAQVVSQNLNIPETEFIKYAREGYLFPDTYLVPKTATAVAVIKIFADNFDRRFNDELKQKARERNLTVEEVVTLASLVEREARFEEDRKKVASVLLRRLEDGIKLDVDATVQYALGYQADEKNWWKKELSLDDLEIDSPYNTYKNAGFPPGPIANPGLAAIKAVIDADPNAPNFYYVSDKSGRLHFAKTLEEHNENIRKYLK
ncbi:endolytic transglycosylase MltG [Candidatus Roizmanbacteria bacterium]|nr:endolytic transglycosylase MltG [Candidatus Roizmanbacteria bacterium]